jgi:hypothetical protein
MGNDLQRLKYAAKSVLPKAKQTHTVGLTEKMSICNFIER